MKLLLITQKMDSRDDVLGFMHRWVFELAKHFLSITVICLEKGEVSLPQNVRVLSLGKEKQELGIMNYELWKRAGYVIGFVRYIVQNRKQYDAVFVHMNHIYVLLGGILWRILGKTITLWYAHGYVPFSLRVAEKFVHLVLTSTKSGFRIPSKKVRVIGQGIDTEFFRPSQHSTWAGHIFKIVSVGRLSPIKNYETLIESIKILTDDKIRIQAEVLGKAGAPEQILYAESLQKLIIAKKLKKSMKFPGALPNTEILSHLQSADFFVNTSLTDSLDKAGLEAMACGLPVLACNDAYRGVFSDYPELLFERRNPVDLARKLKALIKYFETDRNILSSKMRDIVVKNHSLVAFAAKVSNAINAVHHARQHP